MRFFLVLLLALAASLAQAAPPALRDAEGQAYTGKLPARRIIALAPHITDMLVKMGASARIVAVVDDHDVRGSHHRSVGGFPLVADAGSINYEQIVAQRPDVVLVWGSGTPKAWIAQLRQLRLPVFVVDATDLPGLATQLEQLGRLSGQQAAAQAQAAAVRQRLAALQQQYRGVSRLRYFHQVWLQPLYSVHAGNLLSQALALCGADNIVKAGPVAAPLINPEFVLQANPDFILFSETDADASRSYWQRFGALTAVRRQQFLAVDDRRLTRPGPEMLEAVQPVCSRIETWRSGTAMESR